MKENTYIVHMQAFVAKSFLLLFLISFLLTACTDIQKDTGVVAEVNGVPIYFFELDAQRNILFPGLSEAGSPPNDETLRQEYLYALNTLIEYELVRQYLRKIGQSVDESQLVKEEALIQTDHPTADFRQVLLDSGISPALWHLMMMRRQQMITFSTQVLRQQVSISVQEVEAYYREHFEEFSIPEQWNFIYISGQDQELIKESRDVFLETHDATLARLDSTIHIRALLMEKERLPGSILKNLENLKPMTPGSVFFDAEEGYFTFILLDTLPSRKLDIAEIYKRVELTILESKIEDILQEWLDKEIKKSKIRINTHLLVPRAVTKEPTTFYAIPGDYPMDDDYSTGQTNGTDVPEALEAMNSTLGGPATNATVFSVNATTITTNGTDATDLVVGKSNSTNGTGAKNDNGTTTLLPSPDEAVDTANTDDEEEIDRD